MVISKFAVSLAVLNLGVHQDKCIIKHLVKSEGSLESGHVPRSDSVVQND